MAHPSGTKVIGPCRYCGEHYVLTNWMRRRAGDRDEQGRWLSDTHLIACHRKHTAEVHAPNGEHNESPGV